MSRTLRLSLAAVITALAAIGPLAALARADPVPVRIPFLVCLQNGGSVTVPAGTPIFLRSGWSSGTRGLVESAKMKITNTITVTAPGGAVSTTEPPLGATEQAVDGTWAAFFRVDLGALEPGESMTINWIFALRNPAEDILPPNRGGLFPDWDGTGLKYQDHIAAGTYDLGTCKVTAAVT